MFLESLDNRTNVARDYVENRQYQYFPAKLIEFVKTNGEEFEGKEFLESGTQKMYKLYYTAVYESLEAGYIEVSIEDNSAYPEIFTEENKGNLPANLYQQKEINVHDKFEIKGYVALKKTDNGWKAIRLQY